VARAKCVHGDSDLSQCGDCRACRRAYNATPENQAKRRAYNIAPEHREEKAAYMAAWRAEHREELAAYNAAHREEKAAYGAAYRAIPANATRARALVFARKYGITIRQYDRMFADQGGKCILCKRPSRSKRRLCVHHDHKTGAVVALLCTTHNQNLRCFGDSPAGLRAAADKLAAAEARTALILHTSAGPLEKPEHDYWPEED
jgi:hypothetical protein